MSQEYKREIKDQCTTIKLCRLVCSLLEIIALMRAPYCYGCEFIS